MAQLSIEQVRNGIVESTHRVSAAVVDRAGSLVASCGTPDLVTFIRSAAKPYQALPLVQDGVVQRYGITPQELALACASHNSERTQVELVRAFLERIGCAEADLACGPHRALGLSFSVPSVSRDLLAEPSPLASNCSGKHTGMLALARYHGWDIEGYHQSGHPVQDRIKRELARWVELDETAIGEGVDGCTTVAFALSLSEMAGAVARLISGDGEAEKAIVSAMVEYPELVAGQGRLCTELMRAYPRRVVVKVGAEGVFIAGLLDRGVGVALKVEDGDPKAAMVALVAVLDGLELDPMSSAVLPQFAEMPVLNTRGDSVGSLRASSVPSFV